jgi:hypothetical protein
MSMKPTLEETAERVKGYLESLGRPQSVLELAEALRMGNRRGLLGDAVMMLEKAKTIQATDGRDGAGFNRWELVKESADIILAKTIFGEKGAAARGFIEGTDAGDLEPSKADLNPSRHKPELYEMVSLIVDVADNRSFQDCDGWAGILRATLAFLKAEQARREGLMAMPWPEIQKLEIVLENAPQSLSGSPSDGQVQTE